MADDHSKPELVCLAVISKKFTPLLIHNFSNLDDLDVENLIFISLDGLEQKSDF